MSEILNAFLRNEAAILRYLTRFRVGAAAAQDLLQETFLRGFAAELKTDIKEPKAYLFQIAQKLVLESMRRDGRSPTLALEDCGGAEQLLDEDQAGAEEWLEGRRKLALFVRAVAELPPQCRKAFLLRRIDRLQFKQIANRMSISVSAVEKHVMTGLLKCNAYLREHGYDPRDLVGTVKSANVSSDDDTPGATTEAASSDE
ncbi:RNA polymerase sigma factor [Steroidobacter sp.]|uniref:RNA polymerase sigma factor n=1 Tax=Steroidobacter sp. TaxID=1978227 RepID=UPI001A419752|nr:sigma-70 family RNA polymerase sigma factor [Steroidobacter sp.]MBL8266374.1 sigma-70 family RNA polymerase sigma factor [Steroidobacter sp.]